MKFLEFILYSQLFHFSFGILLAAVSGCFALTKQLQMFQQNSYYPSRYIKWLKENEKRLFIFRALFFVVIASLNLSNSLAAVLVLLLLLIYLIISVITAVSSQKKAIKKLVFTAKTKRMYTALILIFALLFVLQFFFGKDSFYWFFGFSLLLSVFPELSVFLLFALLYPFEKAITKHYTNDAKKILSQFGSSLKVIGITGSFGKTSTKFILNDILSTTFNVVCTPHSFNTPMGVVRTVRENLRHETEIFICEMGAKNIGDIKEICDIVSPDGGIITSVGPQHLETFGDVRNVLNTKFELYDCSKNKETSVFVNGDNEYIEKKLLGVKAVTYGLKPTNDFYSDNIVCSSYGSTFDLHLGSETVTLTTKLLGKHNILNITGAAAYAYTLGVSPDNIKLAVMKLKPTEHRLQIKPFMKNSVLIDDAYNSNPVGSLLACEVLGTFGEMKKIIVTPGLVELGEKEYEYNYNLGVAAAKVCDIIIYVGNDRSRPLKEGSLSCGFDENKIYTVSSFKEAMDVYSTLADENTVVLFENDLPDNYLK